MKKSVLTCLELGLSKSAIANLPFKTDAEYDSDALLALLNASGIREFYAYELEYVSTKVNNIINNCKRLGIKIVTIFDDDFPKRLKNTPDCPVLLYVKGDLRKLNSMPAVAVVGTRYPSKSGEKAAYDASRALALWGVADVSGLAYGCDTQGHRGCLAGKGYTIAVLAGGLDDIYPAVHKPVAESILENGGALVSEYPPFVRPCAKQFVERDRLQAGMSDAVFVIETGLKGGTYHAVRKAGEYGRSLWVFEHPDGSDKSRAQGNERLIKGGALPIRDLKTLAEAVPTLN